MLAHTHTVWRSPTEETQKGGITPGRHNASGRCDHDGNGEKYIRGKEIGADLVLNPTNLPGRCQVGGGGEERAAVGDEHTSLTLGLPYPTLRRAQCVGATGLFDIPVLLDGCTSGRASAKYTAKLV
jgi:hypothetical protein